MYVQSTGLHFVVRPPIPQLHLRFKNTIQQNICQLEYYELAVEPSY